MKRQPVESSLFEAVGYDPETCVLELAFTNGRIYQYFNVSSEVHDQLLKAPSLGKYFLANIQNVYNCVQVR
jgi:hypothetical protein